MAQISKVFFSHNWNNKLNCRAFTMLRLYDPKKWVVGQAYDVFIRPKGKDPQFVNQFTCRGIRAFQADKLNEFVAYLDTGYNTAQTREIIRKMYPKKDNPRLHLILLVRS